MHPAADTRLQYLAVVLAEEMNFSRAAKRAGMAQPAFSRAIRYLEGSLGVQLFRRTTRLVTITQEGKEFVYGARRALHCMRRTIESVVNRARLPEKIVIGYPTFLDPVLVLRLDEIRLTQLPSLRPISQSSCTAEIVSNLENGAFDCGVVAMPDEYSELKPFRRLPLGDCPVAALLRSDHPLATKPVLELSDLAGQPLVVQARDHNPALYSWLERQCAAHKFSPTVAYESRNLLEHTALVSHGNGIGFGLLPRVTENSRPAFLSSNLVIRRFRDRNLAVPVAMIFGERFNEKPLRLFVAAVTKLRNEYTARKGTDRRASVAAAKSPKSDGTEA